MHDDGARSLGRQGWLESEIVKEFSLSRRKNQMVLGTDLVRERWFRCYDVLL
jgi:hypothetical protein